MGRADPKESPSTDSSISSLPTAYEPDHITLAPLRLLHGTRLYDRCRAGAVKPMEAKMAADLYEEAAERLETLGYRQYTASGFALRQGKIFLQPPEDLLKGLGGHEPGAASLQADRRDGPAPWKD